MNGLKKEREKVKKRTHNLINQIKNFLCSRNLHRFGSVDENRIKCKWCGYEEEIDTTWIDEYKKWEEEYDGEKEEYEREMGKER